MRAFFDAPATLIWRGADIVDVCAVDASYGSLLALTADGGLHGVDVSSGAIKLLCQVVLPTLAPDVEDSACFGRYGLQLHASANGEFAAIVVNRGREGLLAATASGEIIMRLDGGDYCEGTVPFSAAFVRHAGRDILIHRTAWNRLEASDAASGALLTERYIAPNESGQPDPDHYLDYFHGRLYVSPEGGRIFDDGWVWHPVVVGVTWSLNDWLQKNPWESEDGASRGSFSMRDDWNIPACWIDEDHLALWGWADWDDEEFAETSQGSGVCIFDFGASREPAVRRVPMALTGMVSALFSDGRHVFVVADNGTTVWDIASGLQVAAADFIPLLHDRTRGRLVAWAADSITEWALPPVRDAEQGGTNPTQTAR